MKLVLAKMEGRLEEPIAVEVNKETYTHSFDLSLDKLIFPNLSIFSSF